MKNIPIQIKLIAALLIISAAGTGIKKVYSSVATMYNTTTDLRFKYTKITDQQVTDYDGYYQMYSEKLGITDISVETFVHVTDIIMSNRKDGETLAWKWVKENQNIPYNEFTRFYESLSDFIEESLKNNMVNERKKQDIVYLHNLTINKFPNRLYNKALGIQALTYQAGYLTQETKLKFKK